MTDDINKIATPRGEGRSMQSLSPYAIAESNVSFSYTGSNWFGPLPPIAPIAPPEVAGRTWDYIPGYNLATQPRTYEPINFHMLRMLADAYDPVRLIIERRKDQMCRVPFVIRTKHDGGGKPPSHAQLSSQKRGLIKDVTEFFKYPTDNMSFRTWLRMLLEDLLVLDAPALYCERTPGGTLVGLAPTDGSTVKVVIDDKGRTPRAFRWDGQPFVWNGETVNTSNYAQLGFKIVDGLLYPIAYQQALKGQVAVNLSTWDLIYKPLNLRTHGVYGRGPVEQIITTVSTAMRRAASQLEYFREGNQPDALFALPPDWTPDQLQKFQDYFDSLYSGNLANRRRMKFVVGGSKESYIELKEPPLKSDFDEWLVRIVCFAFSYPPSAFVSLSNRSIAESHERQAEEEGLEPLKLWFCDLANEIIEREFSNEVEFAWAEEQDIDPEKQSKILTRYAEAGAITLNQLREKIGEEPDANPAANQLMVRTPMGYVPVGAVADNTDQKGN
jgi:hypothetical protein